MALSRWRIDLHHLHAIFPIIGLSVFIKPERTLFHKEKVLVLCEPTVYLLLIRAIWLQLHCSLEYS